MSATAEKKSIWKELQEHLMFAMSYMIPLLMGGALVMAIPRIIGLACGVTTLGNYAEGEGFFHILYLINSTAMYSLKLVPLLIGAAVAYSIGDKPALGAGLIGGTIAWKTNGGFLAALILGFAVGYAVKFVKEHVHVKQDYMAAMAMVLLPFTGTAVAVALGLLLANPLAAINTGLESWLTELTTSQTSSYVLAIVIGAMVAVDLGGPVNKACNTVCNALVASGIYTPKAIEVCCIVTAPLGWFIAGLVHKDKFSKELQEANKSTGIMAFFGLSEGAIPFTLVNPLRLIPLNILGGIAAGVCAVFLGVNGYMAPVGGLYGFITIGNPVGYLISAFVGSLVIGLVGPLVVDFKDDVAEELSEDDIEISIE